MATFSQPDCMVKNPNPVEELSRQLQEEREVDMDEEGESAEVDQSTVS